MTDRDRKAYEKMRANWDGVEWLSLLKEAFIAGYYATQCEAPKHPSVAFQEWVDARD